MAKTRKDYEEEAILKNWATAQPGSYYSNGGKMEQYTGWNGGSVTGADMMAAVGDANRYDYDIMLDPRNNGGARDAIGNLLLDVSERANADAVAGKGDYDTNRQNYLNQIGWTDYQNVFKSLQDTGTLGLKTLDGKSIEEAYSLGNPNWMSNEQWAAYEKEMAPIWAEQQAIMQQMADRDAYVQQHLSPLMGGNNAGFGGENGGEWGYDQNTDPVWDAYLKQYTRAADKSMNDALAQLSARTGGLASTYAGQVAQQTHNDVMQGATDMIPKLYEAAYGRWMDEQEMARADDETAYRRQQDALDRQLAADQTAWERQAYSDELAYNREQDALDRAFAQDQFDWEQTKYWNNLNKGGSSSPSLKYDDFVDLVIAGYTPTKEEMDAYGLDKAKVVAIRNSAQKDAEPSYDLDKIMGKLDEAETLEDVVQVIDLYGTLHEDFQEIAPLLYESYKKRFGEQDSDEEEPVWKRLLGGIFG